MATLETQYKNWLKENEPITYSEWLGKFSEIHNLDKLKETINTICKDCNTSLQDCTCIEDTINMENQSKEYAKDLVWKYYHILEHTISNEYSKVDWQIAKQCALICINELLEHTKEARFPMNSGESFHEPYDYDEYLLEVKQEIEKL